MSNFKARQVGFAIVVVALVIIGVGVVAVKKPSQTKTAIAALPTPATVAPSKVIEAVPATSGAAQPYLLEIKEWGVSIPLPESLKDVYYTPARGASTREDGVSSMMLVGLRSLDGDKKCSAIQANDNGSTPLAAIISVSPDATDPVTGDLLSKQYPDGVTIGSYYYAYEKIGGTKCKPTTTRVDIIHQAFGPALKATTKSASNER